MAIRACIRQTDRSFGRRGRYSLDRRLCNLARGEEQAAGEMLARAEKKLAAREGEGLEEWARRVRTAGG
jgi:hypothetical protein